MTDHLTKIRMRINFMIKNIEIMDGVHLKFSQVYIKPLPLTVIYLVLDVSFTTYFLTKKSVCCKQTNRNKRIIFTQK